MIRGLYMWRPKMPGNSCGSRSLQAEKKKNGSRFLRGSKEPHLTQAVEWVPGFGLQAPAARSRMLHKLRGCGQGPLTSCIEARHRHRMQEETRAINWLQLAKPNCTRPRVLNASAAYAHHAQRVPLGRLQAASCNSSHLMRLLLSASRDETLQLNMQNMSVRMPNHARPREWLSVAARPRHAAVPLAHTSSRIASHCIASLCPRARAGAGSPSDHMRAQPKAALKNGPHRPRNRPGYRNPSRNTGGQQPGSR